MTDSPIQVGSVAAMNKSPNAIVAVPRSIGLSVIICPCTYTDGTDSNQTYTM